MRLAKVFVSVLACIDIRNCNVLVSETEKINKLILGNSTIMESCDNILIESRLKKPLRAFEKEVCRDKTVKDLIGIRVIYQPRFDEYITALQLSDIVKQEYDIYKVKDYVRHPKQNNYQSVHLLTENPKPIEFQIRSKRMHEIATKGSAAVRNWDDYI